MEAAGVARFDIDGTSNSEVVRLDLNDPRDVSNMDHIRRRGIWGCVSEYGTRGLLGYEYHY